MSRVTSKLQVTVPKAIADRYGIAPGQELEWLEAGDGIRVVPETTRARTDPAGRLALFDRATERQRAREQAADHLLHSTDRGWTRDQLYARARAR
jgi:AbrB family looped-hinge helix DNA binding protein